MQTLQLDIKENIAHLQFQRPEAMNSFNEVMAEELATITDDLLHNKDVHAVLLSGAERCFMAGGDITFFKAHLDNMPQGVGNLIDKLNTAVLNIRKLPVPVLAAVHGSVAGAGMSLMLAADLVIAAESCQFNLAYTHIGTSPDGGLSKQLVEHIGLKKAMELLLLSERFDAKQALQLGLINWLIDDNEMLARAQKILSCLSHGPRFAYQQIKQLAYQASSNSMAEQMQAEKAAFVACSASTDFKAGVNAFLSRQVPEFSGN